MKYAILFFLISSNALAFNFEGAEKYGTPLGNNLGCPSHTSLNSGDTTSCSGRFINDKSDKKVRDKYSVLEQTVEVQKERLTLKDLAIDTKSKEADLWKAEAEKQAVEVQKGKNDLRNGVLMGVGGAALLMFLLNGAKK